MTIRVLTPEDWKNWKHFRLEALKNSPESFGSSYEEELHWPDLKFQNSLNKNYILGAFIDGILAASTGFYSLKQQKKKHRGVIWGMYTKPEYREQGLASALIQAIITFAKSQANQLHVTCISNNLPAIRFYNQHGFKMYGTEPRALKIADTFFDEHLMMLDLTEQPMKKLDTYLSLCTKFYDLSKPKPEANAYAFYRAYTENSSGPILEPMCGTGRFLLPLLEEGFDVHGFDASDHMLEALFAKARDRNLHPTVWKGFIENLKRPEKYSLIFIPSGSFCLIVDSVAITSAIKTLYEHLTDDGILLLEGETPHAVPPLNIWRGSQWSRPDGKIIMLSSCATLDGNICSSIGKYELIHNNSIIRTEIEEYKVRIYEAVELVAILKSCGFKQVRAIKAFDSVGVPGDTDKSIVYECRK